MNPPEWPYDPPGRTRPSGSRAHTSVRHTVSSLHTDSGGHAEARTSTHRHAQARTSRRTEAVSLIFTPRETARWLGAGNVAKILMP
eukprot:7385150-Prymnesium_polylepis.1